MLHNTGLSKNLLRPRLWSTFTAFYIICITSGTWCNNVDLSIFILCKKQHKRSHIMKKPVKRQVLKTKWLKFKLKDLRNKQEVSMHHSMMNFADASENIKFIHNRNSNKTPHTVLVFTKTPEFKKIIAVSAVFIIPCRQRWHIKTWMCQVQFTEAAHYSDTLYRRTMSIRTGLKILQLAYRCMHRSVYKSSY